MYDLTNNLIKVLKKELSDSFNDMVKATPELIKTVKNRNCSTKGVYFTKWDLIFTNEYALSSWKNYGGYRHIENDAKVITDEDGEFLVAIYNEWDSGRIFDDLYDLRMEVK